MSTTYPLATLAAVISPTGITAPAYADILASLLASFKAIYGTDSYIAPDSQDGQLLAIFAQAIHDCNQATIAAYNAYSPATAQGEALSNAVKLNHIARGVPSNSQVLVTLVGQLGTTINGGIVGDSAGNRWFLPATVVIPSGGSITVTATAEVAGAVAAAVGAVNKIITPTAGWQSVTNASSASKGNAVETDGELRIRQQTSTALHGRTVLDGLVGALQGLLGVSYASAYENDTGTTDANGVPGHSIAVVVEGGDSAAIAEAIFEKKTPGCGTFGTTSVAVLDPLGVPRVINYFVPEVVMIDVEVQITAGIGYTATIGEEIKAALALAVNSQVVGQDVEVSRLYVPALLNGGVNSLTYVVIWVGAALHGDILGTPPLVMAFNQKAGLPLANITITLV